MALRKQNFAPGEIYHIYNRGVDKRIIFIDSNDFNFFIHLLYICNTEKSIVLRDLSENFERGNNIVEIGLYVLMPNHFHILVKETQEGGITSFMRKVLTSYSMYFNKKYDRTGKLWQGVFQAIHVNKDEYLKYLYSYIHLNPAKLIDKNWKVNKRRNTQKLLDHCVNYEYSSIQEYKNNIFYIVNHSNFPKYFINFTKHQNELFEWLNFDIKKDT